MGTQWEHRPGYGPPPVGQVTEQLRAECRRLTGLHGPALEAGYAAAPGPAAFKLTKALTQ